MIDVSGKLNKGKNTIAILVWYFEKNGFSHHSSCKAGMVFELYNNNDLAVISSKKWKTKIHSSYLQSYSGPQPNYRLPESNVIYDAQKEIGDWSKINFERIGWRAAFELGIPTCGPWNNLVNRPIPYWENSIQCNWRYNKITVSYWNEKNYKNCHYRS